MTQHTNPREAGAERSERGSGAPFGFAEWGEGRVPLVSITAPLAIAEWGEGKIPSLE